MAKIGALTVAGLLLGMLALWSMPALDPGGATFLVLLVVMATNVLGHGVILLVARLRRVGAGPAQP